MLLISFDGFRWDYLKAHNLSNFTYLKQVGSSADFIYNSFATVTFPNHWTIVTGLYEETHGIMQNDMFDPTLNEEFSYASVNSQNIKWYGQNNITVPIWTANQKAGDGRRSAAEWVGGGVTFQNEEIINIPYNQSKPYKELIDEFIKLFTMEDDPINFGALYFDEPDHTGHLYGPFSSQMKEKLMYLDNVLGYLIGELKSHHLFDKLNLIITSDHGMETISEKTAIFLDTLIDVSLFDAYGSRACYSIFVKNSSNVEKVYNQLKSVKNIDVYMKKDIPESLHYKNNVRIGDMIIVANLGHPIYIHNQTVNWTINNGDHGYYNNQSSMYPIFIAHGPAFKQNYTIKSFYNVDIYPLMCFLLGLEPGVNNGTLDNVLDMVIYNEIEKGFSYLFVLFLLIPVSLLIMTTVFICFFSRKAHQSNHNRRGASNDTQYTQLNNAETAVFLDQDNDDLDENLPIIGRQNDE